jgi:ATP-dependent exoDNAse (exonuclease V) beta subunit
MSTPQTPLFTEKQREIIDSFGRGQAVVAGAGCGKTTTLVAKCLALIKVRPTARFCAVSFTEKSVRDLKESLAKGFLKAGVSQDRQSHWVKTIHGLCSTILQEFPVQAGLQGGEKILLEDESTRLWSRSVNLLWSQNENSDISAALDELLKIYSKQKLENLFLKLRSLMSFGVEAFIQKSLDRPEVAHLWLVFESIYRRYQHYKLREGALDFNDLEIFALRALKHKEVQKYYHDRFDLVMVDEFQDTNPLQGEILERFVRPGLTNMCIVGDPKQSIYRFRDADVSVFQDLTEKLALKHLLDTNYRSRPEIIDFVNEVCAPVFEASNLPYEPLIPGRDPDSSFAGARVSRLVLQDESTLAKFLKSEELKGTDLSEYVILARSLRKEKTQKFLNALDQAHVPFLLGSGGRFYSDPRVQELVAFLKGWLSPKNALSQVAALRSPWIGVDDATLLSWKDHYFERFFADSPHIIARTLKDWFLNHTPVRPGQILEKLWDVIDPELYTPLVALWHKAEALSSQGQRFEEVVMYFSHAIEDDKIEKEIPPPAQKGVVRLMTVHGSKGLQFPRVILIDLDGDYRSAGASQDLIWDRKKGVHLMNRDDYGKKDKDDSENTAWQEIEKSAAVAESKRVFYVAVTRPQEELILAWKAEVKPSGASKKPGYNPRLTDNWRAWVESTVVPAEKTWTPLAVPAEAAPQASFEFDAAPATETLKRIEFDPGVYRPRHSPSEWLVLNQCALRYQNLYLKTLSQDANEEQSRADGLKKKIEDDQKADEGSFNHSETVAQKGERVHALIEHEKWDELVNEFSTPESGTLIVEKLREILTPTTEIYKELGFEVPLKGLEALVGMMDRLEIDEKTESIRVVDYKWTAKAKPAAELLSHYLLQLQLYAWAASKLVSFQPKKIEACLIHFTADSIEIVNAPLEALKTGVLETQIQNFFGRAKGVLEVVLKGRENEPKTGDYCRYCEFKKICPAWAK